MGNRFLTRATNIETGRNTPQKWDRLRLLPRHIRTSLPLLPSGPGGVRAFVIARSPKPDIRISNFIFEFRAKKRRERDSNPHRPFDPPRFQRGAIPIRRSLQKQTRGQGDKEKGRIFSLSPLLLVPLSPCLSSLAERVGFEPTVPVRVQRFSRPPDSATLAPLRIKAHLFLITYPGKLSSEVFFIAGAGRGLAPPPEESLHQSTAFFGAHSRSNFHLVIQRTVRANLKDSVDSARPQIGGAVNQALHSCVDQRPGAHRAGFNSNV